MNPVNGSRTLIVVLLLIFAGCTVPSEPLEENSAQGVVRTNLSKTATTKIIINETSVGNKENNNAIQNISHSNTTPEIELPFYAIHKFDVDEFVAKLHERVNAERTNHNIRVVEWDTRLAEIAKKRVDRVIEEGYYNPYEGDNYIGVLYDTADIFHRAKVHDCDGMGESFFPFSLFDSEVVYGAVPPEYWNEIDDVVEYFYVYFISETPRKELYSPVGRGSFISSALTRHGMAAAVHRDYVYLIQEQCSDQQRKPYGVGIKKANVSSALDFYRSLK
tara:strand:+ start:564 stop:1391 length:828 start_codon:yes stop_codon:yes gene_type:complete